MHLKLIYYYIFLFFLIIYLRKLSDNDYNYYIINKFYENKLFFIKNSSIFFEANGVIKVAASLATMTNLKQLSLNLR